jgi:hypothetical protein
MISFEYQDSLSEQTVIGEVLRDMGADLAALEERGTLTGKTQFV